MKQDRYHKDLSERNKWIYKRYKELLKLNPQIDLKQIYVQIARELNKKFPLLWINTGTIRHICKKYGSYK